MRIDELKGPCQGKSAAAIDYLIKNTDEYLRAKEAGVEADILSVYAAGVLFLRDEAQDTRGALWRAAEQGMAVTGAEKGLIEAGRTLTWVPSGPVKQGAALGKDNHFVRFLNDGTTFDLSNPGTTLNCWEAILLSAMLGGLLDNGTSLIRLYEDPQRFDKLLTQALVSGAGRPYRPNAPLGTPVRGDIVLFSGLDHVAIATGRNDSSQTEILSFWPAPALPLNKVRPGTQTVMLRTSIEAIGAWLVVNLPDEPNNITFGAPDWPVLNQS